MKILGKKAKYLVEKYRDEFNTLHQSIMINLDINDQSNGEEAKFMRSRINPNLTTLYEIIYMDKSQFPIKMERLINGDWYDIDIETFEVIGLCK